MFSKNHRIFPLFMWLLPLLFFAFQFVLRLWPSLLTQQIMEKFSINATLFGIMASTYYYGYALMQIPVAILLDRFGAKKIISIFALLCGLASFLFNFTDHWILALLGRLLIGVGSAVGFLGASKVISEWFPNRLYAKMVGFTFSIGLLGAFYGGRPTSILINTYGVEKVAYALSLFSILIALIIFICLRKPKRDSLYSEITEPFEKKDLLGMLKLKEVWILGIANLLMVGFLEGFADVWGVSYLMKAYSLTKDSAAGFVSFIFIGMIFGGPFLAFLSGKLGNYPVILLAGFTMAALFLNLLWFGGNFGSLGLIVTFFCIGVLSCYQVIVFAAGNEMVTTKMLGVTIAFLNCANMLGGSFFHTLTGTLMDYFWIGGVENGIKVYTLSTYKLALLGLPFSALLGTLLILYLAIKRKRVAV